ncbi:MAG: sigma-54-dependent Fis family transcriptional regulator [Kiritimatiellae bacterium]|nr:sigma-54-dependent Fis family transcriptional regulator [Kiritimatiellia bacterium]
MENNTGKTAARAAGRGAGKPSILVVDDERNTREGLAMALRRDWDVRTAESKDAALALLAEAPADVMLSDVRMPGGSGLELLQAARAAHPRMACVLLTAYGSVETAVEAMKLGAADFLTKPVNLDQLDIVLARTLRTRALERENRELRKRLDDRYGLENIVGSSPEMERVFDVIRQAAPSQATVLVEGPSGTGKELVAQALHHLSPRAAGPFVAVHCAALSPTLLESELFGHEKGAFTGAVAQSRGRFEQAGGGTLFLDEVGEIAPEVQVKLLRVLETRTFERVGGSETLRADFRIVAATNRDLKAEVAAGRFREDLYYRLAVVTIRMPTLAERAGDVPMLCDHFLKQFASESGTGAAKRLEPAALALLQAYPWPGNVRELRNAVERMTVLSRGETITVADVPPEIRDAAAAAAPAGAVPGESLADAEKRQILAALERAGGNRSKAADELGINRRTLHRKLAAWGVPPRRGAAAR